MKSIFVSAALFICLYTSAQTVDIDNTGGNSGLIGLGASNYHASESIYTDAEIGSGNFTSAGTAIEKIAFKAVAVGATSSFGNVNLYLKNIPATTTTLSTGTYTTSGYTLVFSGTVVISGTGFTNITLSTPFVRNAGDNLQLLVERTDNVAHAGFNYQTSNGNSINLTLTTTRRYNGTVALSGSTSLAASAFRPALRLLHEYATDIAVQEVYTLGRLPIVNGTPHVVSSLLKNFGGTTVTNLNVTLNVTGANSFTNTQIITSLAPGASQLVTFAGYTPASEGLNNVTVSIPADDYTGNDSKSSSQIVNQNTWSYADESGPFGSTGSTASTIDLVAKFNTNTNTSISQVRLHFSNTAGRAYKVAFWDATGAGGTPGTLIWESPANLTTAPGYNLVVLPVPVAISAGNFYAGVRQAVSASSVFLSYQKESPVRTNTFYYASPSGGTWIDMAAVTTTPYRLMIEPKHILAINAAATNISGPTSAANCSKTIGITIANAGSNPIAAGTASVTLKVSGANTYTSSQTNTTLINTGGTELINFTVPVPNAGTNFDTAFVTLTGDGDQLNDSIAASFSSGITAALNTATNNTISLVKNCEESGWTYYSDPANYSTSLFAIQWDPSSTGANTLPKANAIPKLQLDASFFAAEDIPAKKATYTMRRYWNVDLAGNPLTGPVNVRFFYDATEKTAIENAANTFASTNAGTLEPFTWFQLNTPSFAGDAAHVTPDYVLNAYPIFNSNTVNNTVNGILYAQFDGLTNLVGGTYATGVGPSTPLPLSLLSFEAKKAGRQHLLIWKTANEINVRNFIVERSSNGIDFTEIGELPATGQHNYEFTDAAVLKGLNYYRLKITDLNGNSRLSQVRLLNAETIGISVYPNPARNSAMLEFESSGPQKASITVFDITGKMVHTKTVLLQPGINRIPVDLEKIAPGSYQLKLQKDDFTGIIKLIRF